MDYNRISDRIIHQVGLASAAALLARAGAAAQAQTADGPGARGDGPRQAWAQRGTAPGELQERFMRYLDLSDEQRGQIAGIRERSRADAGEMREQMQALHEEIRASIEAGGFNETQVRVLIDSRAQLLVDSMLHRVRTQAEIGAVLTPEQRAKMAELRERRSHRGRQRQGG